MIKGGVAAAEFEASFVEVGKSMPTSRKSITRVELSDAVYRTKVGLTRTESSILVDLVLKEITHAIVRGETVKLSSFGTFTVREKSQRIGRNPKTGVEVPIFAHRAVIFRASAIMKQKIQNTAKSNAPTETTEVLRAIAADPVF